MKKIVMLVLVAISFYSCTDSLSDDVNQNCGDIKNVAFESFAYCGQLKETPTRPVYVIISSAAEMQSKFTTCETFTPVYPDFTQKRILGLFAGPKPSLGYEIKIQSVIENDCQILVEYTEKEPGANASAATVMSYPADYIVLPKSDKPISFSKVTPVADYAVIGSYIANPESSQCNGLCNDFYKVEKYKVVQYLGNVLTAADRNQLPYKSLVYIDDYADFLLKVPTEIKGLKGQTKTYGTPGTDNHAGVYFEWSQAGVVTKIYLDATNTTDQTAEVIAFKKVIQDKITVLKTKS